jgi:transcriptional regulator with XRE-family HTH domain
MNPETGKTPNKHTEFMGRMIRQAREALGMSQDELGEKIYRKRLAVSEMENGKVEISAWTLPLLAAALKKPFSYFFPPSLRVDIPKDSLDQSEHELITNFRDVSDEELQKVAIDLVKVISEFDPMEMLLGKIDLAIDEKQRRKDLEELLLSKKKKLF